MGGGEGFGAGVLVAVGVNGIGGVAGHLVEEFSDVPEGAGGEGEGAAVVGRKVGVYVFFFSALILC